MSITPNTLAHNLRRGLGSAIIELGDDTTNEELHEVLLAHTLHSISYEPEKEGTKGYYLYTAIVKARVKTKAFPLIIERFSHRIGNKLYAQLLDILGCYLSDGSIEAKDDVRAVIDEKYEYYLARAKRGKLYSGRYRDELVQWSDLIYTLFDIDGFAAFRRFVLDVGAILIDRPEYAALIDESAKLLGRARLRFGVDSVNGYIERRSEHNDAVKTFGALVKLTPMSAAIEETLSGAEPLYKKATEALATESPRAFMARTALRYGARAKEDEIEKLARLVLVEEDESLRALLMLPFQYKEFPLDPTPIIEWTASGNELLAEVSFNVLSHKTSPKVRAFALSLLDAEEPDYRALPLLIRNRRKGDDVKIRHAVEATTHIGSSIQKAIYEIYTDPYNSTPVSYATLLHVYKYGKSAYWRCRIVETMKKCGVLTEDLVNELIYDSYEETRKIAQRELDVITARKERERLEYLAKIAAQTIAAE